MYDHRVAGAAEVRGHLLRPLEWSVHGPGPSNRHVRLARWSANFVEPLDRACQSELQADQAGDLAERSFQPPLGARAIVADDVHHQRVIELTRKGEAVDQATDLEVGVVHVRRIILHQPAVNIPGIGRLVIPRGDARGRGVSCVPRGMMPMSSCFACVSSRCLSQPWSNLPLYFSRKLLRGVVRGVDT